LEKQSSHKEPWPHRRVIFRMRVMGMSIMSMRFLPQNSTLGVCMCLCYFVFA